MKKIHLLFRLASIISLSISTASCGIFESSQNSTATPSASITQPSQSQSITPSKSSEPSQSQSTTSSNNPQSSQVPSSSASLALKPSAKPSYSQSTTPQPRNQSPPRPYVVLVNGYMDCCVWDTKSRGIFMVTIAKELQNRGVEFRLVPWDTFRDGAAQRSITSNDSAFLHDAADFINNQLDPNRPLILIGHSYGGDSLLSLAPRINRRIQFLGVIDPTAAAGFREPVTRRGVPSNVDYFFNRWEKNALGKGNVVPFDSRLVSGYISSCNARNCDQEEQNIVRQENGSEIRVKCGSLEVSCPGYDIRPGHSNGTKAKRMAHNDMPFDEYLQRQMIDRIISVVYR